MIDSTQSSTRVDLIDASGYGNSDPVYGDFYPADCIPTAIIRNQYFYLISKTSAFSHALNASFEDVSGKKDIPVDMTKFTQMGIPGLYSLPIPYTRTDGKLSDGHYSVSFDLGYWHHLKSTEFNIDTTAPQLSGAEIEGGVPASEVATLSESKKILAGGERTLRLRLQDLLPRASGQNPEVSSRDETFTSTLDEQKSTISISIARSLNDENPQFDTKSIAELKRSSDGYVDLQLKESGLYKLHDIKIVLYDKCGNSCTVDLGTYAGEHDWGIDSILVDNQTTKPKTQLSLENAPNTPKTKDLKIRRGTVILRATVTDPWFEVYQVLFGAEPILKIRYTALDGTSHELEPKSVSQFVPGGGHIVSTAYSYVYTYDLPRNMDDTQDPKRPREGSYEVSLEYVGIARHQKGQTFLSNNEVHEEVSSDKQLVTSDSKLEFAIDYTAPKLGHLEMSEVKPVPRYRSGKHKDEPWGWIFAKQEEKVTLQVSDNLAGLQEGTLHINKGSSTAEVESNFRGGLSVLAGEVAFSFKGDGSRLYLDETTITIEDKAGNVASTGALSQYADSNRPAGVHSIAIDESAPKIELSFADNDAHNGKYYNHARKMVVSVNEANFDLIQKYAPDTLIESAKRDGSGSFVQSLKAEDFKATHDADGKKIYVAHAVFEDDADWDVEAFFYDGAGRASNKATASFVIDTQAPSLLVTYDNNEVANGMYYKAPRTATITVHDRNFASELGNIHARTLSGGPAPSVSSWSEIKQREEWRAQVSFAGETHYQLGVTVSDLAGNTAESYDSGEFVIDMTAPKLEITGVEPQHACSGDVVPSVVYSDTNLDVLGSTYTVTGARQGNSYFPNTSERESSTEKQVSLGNIPYELQYDDVYSFDAKAIDLAGNIAQKTIAYSVNRFGSTYFFADNSKNVHGSYLPHPQDVQIIEVNVSGLDTSQSRVELSQDSESCLLEMNKDYAIDPNAPDRGWSATTYTLPAQLFKQDGFYRITLTSKDAAGLLSQNTMEGKDSNHNGSFPVSFAVDQTKPLANLIGVPSGATYLDPNKTALVDAYDNIELRKLEFYIDGKLVTSWKDKELQSGDPKSVVLKIDGKPHDYRVVSQDAAGNSSDTIYSNVVITSDWFVYILRTPHLLVKAVGGVVIVVGLVALIAYLVWRAYKAGEQQRNPFGH